MPYLVVCPQCSAKLKSGQPVPTGRSLTCPQCKNAFTLTEPAPEIDTPAVPAVSKPAAPAPVAPAKPVPVVTAPPVPPRKPVADESNIPAAEILDSEPPRSRRRRDEEEDDRPRSRRRDEDDVRGRARRRDEEEDDRPRSRRSGNEDEEDDLPRSRSRREEAARPLPAAGPSNDFEFNDDPPPARRRRDADDEEDRPSARRRRVDEDASDDEAIVPRYRGKKKGKKGLLIGLIAVAAAFLLCGGGAAVMYFVDPFGLFGGAPSEMLAWMPADTRTIEYVDVAAVAKYENSQFKSRDDFAKEHARLGLRMDEVDSIMTGRTGTTTTKVIKLKSTSTREAVIRTSQGKEATAAGKKYYRTPTGEALYFPNDRLLVYTASEPVMQKLLEKNGRIDLSPELKTATGKASGQIWNAEASPSIFGGGGGFAPGVPGAFKPAPPKYSIMTVALSGNTANLRGELEFTDSEAAKRGAEELERVFAVLKNFGAGAPDNARAKQSRSIFDNIKIRTSGSTVILTSHGPIDGAEDFLPF